MPWRWRARLALLAVFLALQVLPYEAVSNPPERGRAPMPDDLRPWFQESCYDCHSFQVRLPWYASVAPISWWIADEVRRGRAGLNFSTWSDYTPRQRALGWRRSLQRIREQRMPPFGYRLMHPVSLDDEHIRMLENYLKEHERSATDGLSARELLAWPSQPLVETGRPVRGAFRVSGRLKQPLMLEGALILAEGDLVISRGVSGTGAILATGKLTIEGIVGEVGPLALVGQQQIRLSGAPTSQVKAFVHSSSPVVSSGLKLLRQPSFSMPVEGVRQARWDFCRDDGQLGERLERQVSVRYGAGEYVLWDPEFQIVRRASSLDEALDQLEMILASDPATSILRWRRRFRSSWQTKLGQLPLQGSPGWLHLKPDDELGLGKRY